MKNSPKKVLKTTDEKIDYIVSIIGTLATKDELSSVEKNTDKKFEHVISLIDNLATKDELTKKFDDSRKYTDKKFDYVVGLVGNLATKTELVEGLDNLAMMTANGFAHTATKEDVAELNEHVTTLEEVVKNTRQDILTIGDKFVSRPEFEKHVVNFGNLERKVNQITN